VYAPTAKQRQKQQGLPVTDRAGRTIGRLLGRQYHKLVSRPDQILRSPPGFGFDVWAMDFYVLPRVDELVVEDKVNRRVYRSSTENFQKNSLQINRGAGPQYVLPLSYWEVVSDSGRSSAPRPRPAAEVEPKQQAIGGQHRLL
jgi:hypothetical protein